MRGLPTGKVSTGFGFCLASRPQTLEKSEIAKTVRHCMGVTEAAVRGVTLKQREGPGF